MRILAMTILTAAQLVAQTPGAQVSGTRMSGTPAPLSYPATRKADVVEDYHGTPVADPYRWLEDDNSAETKAWVQAQNRLSSAWLAEVPQRAAIAERLRQRWNYARTGIPFRRGRHYFVSHNTGLQNQSVLYVSDDPARLGRVLLDPNTLSKDGTVALSGYSVTEDGRLLAYSVSVAGSDWQTWKVREVATGHDLPDEVKWSKSSGAAWLKDGSGFFYSRYDAPAEGDALKGANLNHKVYFHKIGTNQSADTLVYARPDQPEWYLEASVSDDGRWLIISGNKGTNPEQAIFLRDLARPDAKVEPLLDRMDASYQVVDNQGDTFYIVTSKDAPRHRLVAVTRGKAQPSAWKELIPQGRDVLEGVSLLGGRFVATWMRDARSAVTFHDLKGRRTGELELPALGAVSGFGGRREDMETFYSFTTFTQAPSVYRYDFKSGRSTLLHAPRTGVDPKDFVVRQVFYPSKDGTKIPMFLVHRKDLVLDGANPTLLYGYGGFNVPLTPAYSPRTIVWLEMGGVYAMANLRGGGEYGLDWYDAGRREKKQNVFDDFIAAAEWLIANKYTSTPRLAINGGSNGGLLVGACLTQRPELFGAAVPEVGVMDMLRFHRFTLGWGWKSDYGSSETPEGFATLMKYSPLHTIRPGRAYPPTLVLTGDHDDRVVPAHSHKFTATLQAAQGGPAPILTRIETDAGHGAGKPTAKAIQERADVLAFLVRALGMTLPKGF